MRKETVVDVETIAAAFFAPVFALAMLALIEHLSKEPNRG
jgi:hypothetical protein